MTSGSACLLKTSVAKAVDGRREAAAEALDRRDRSAPAIDDATLASAPTFEAEERAGVDAQDGAAEGVIPGEAIAECMWEREHPLADGDVRQDVVNKISRPGGHSPTPATRTKAASFAGKRHEPFGVATVALKTCKTPGPNSTVQEAAELLFEERGESAGIGAGSGPTPSK